MTGSAWYFRCVVIGSSSSLGRRALTVTLVVAGAIAIAACGTTRPSQTDGTRLGTYMVKVSESFPSHQKLSQTTQLVVNVTNDSKSTLPNVAVTLSNARQGDDKQAEGTLLPPSESAPPLLTNRSRPIWTIHRAPGPCGRNCQNLGPGPGAASYARTWALGQLRPGQTMKFDWHVTAVQPGNFTVRYSVAADVAGGVKTVLPDGAPATGELAVTIAGLPLRPLTKTKTSASG